MARIIPAREAIEVAAELLQAGQLVSFPTETVYGLGANACDGLAVARIFELKGRPKFNPLIVHVNSIEKAENLGVFDNTSQELAKAFWPGALTIVVPLKPDNKLSELVSAGLDTIALRIPMHEIALEILDKAGCPVAAPSANLSGHVSPTTAQHVASDFASSDLTIVDGGATGFGIESTVVQCRNDRVYLLRHGSITTEDIAKRSGKEVIVSTPDQHHPTSPGQLLNHYSPNSHVRLNVTSVTSDERLLAFGSNIPLGAERVLNLSPDGDLKQAAANLFAMLRDLDKGPEATIAVMPIPDHGIGVAINDRLKKAAAPKE